MEPEHLELLGVINLFHLYSIAISYSGEEVSLGHTKERNGSSPTLNLILWQVTVGIFKPFLLIASS